MKTRFVQDEDPDVEEVEAPKAKLTLGDDSGSNTIVNTAGHQPGEDAHWSSFYELTINEPDVDPKQAAEFLRLKLGTQVEVNGSVLKIYLLSHKIRRRLTQVLNELLVNSQVQADSVRYAA